MHFPPTYFHALILSVFLLPSSFAIAAEPAGSDPAIEKIRAQLSGKLGDVSLDSIETSPVPGLYEVLIGARLYYVSADGRYFIQGQMTDIETGTNLTEAKVATARKKLIDEIGEDNMIVFGKGDEKHTIDVFTDIDCGYCRKLHAEMDAYNDKGIRVRYLFYPRSGVASESGRKAVSVWCSEDQEEAMDKAKQGKSLEQKNCTNPVADQYALGKVVGISGTPALVLDSGELIPGYIPPARLKQLLDSKLTEKK